MRYRLLLLVFGAVLFVGVWVCLSEAAAKIPKTISAAQETIALSTHETLSLPASPAVGSVSSSTPAVNPLLNAIRDGMDEGVSSNADARPALYPQNQGEIASLQLGRLLLSLGMVLAVVLGLAWFARRYLFKHTALGGGHIGYVGSFSLSQKSKLHLIRVGNETFLIGEGNNQLSLISKVNLDEKPLAERDESAPPESLPMHPTFQSRLSQWQQTLDNQSLQEEVKQSLLVLGGLSKRLAKKGDADG